MWASSEFRQRTFPHRPRTFRSTIIHLSGIWAHVVVSLVSHFMLWKWGEKTSVLTNKEKEKGALSCLRVILLVITQPMSFMVGLRLEKVDSNHSIFLFFFWQKKKWVEGEWTLYSPVKNSLIIFRLFEIEMRCKKHQHTTSC